MAGSTPTYGLPYQTNTDPPNGPLLGEELAEAVETELARIEGTIPTSETGLKVSATSGTMTSGTFVNLPSTTTSSFSFTKRATSSSIRIDMGFRAFSASAGSTGLRLAVRINGVDYDVALGYFTTTDQYEAFAGFAYVAAGLAPGTYTVQARWRRSTGTGTITTNSGISELDMSAREVDA